MVVSNMKMLKKIYGCVFFCFCIIPIFAILKTCEQAFHSPLDFFADAEKSFLIYVPLLISGAVAYVTSSKKDGYHVICGVVTYTVLTSLLSTTVLNEALEFTKYYANVSMVYLRNPLTAVCCGVLSGYIGDHFSNIRLPQTFSFFSGKRLVPIICLFIVICLSPFVYVIWNQIFWILNSLFSALFASGKAGISIACGLDEMLEIAGLKNIFDRFYILPGINQGTFIVTHYVTAILLFAGFLIEKNKKVKFLCLFLFLEAVCANEQYCFSIALLLESLPMWLFYHFSMAAAGYLLYFFDQKIIVLMFVTLFIIMFRLTVGKNRKIFSWYSEYFDYAVPLAPEQLILLLGDFENIKEISKKGSVIRVDIFNDGFVCQEQLKKSGLQYEIDDALNFYFGNKAEEYYEALNELIQQNLLCLKL